MDSLIPSWGAAAETAAEAEALVSQLLLRAWTAAPDAAPPLPSFLFGVQQQMLIAGLQLQLLQLLGGRGQRLAERLGWLAYLEARELQDMMLGGSNNSLSSRMGNRQGSAWTVLHWVAWVIMVKLQLLVEAPG